jgi:hypothetical protein
VTSRTDRHASTVGGFDPPTVRMNMPGPNSNPRGVPDAPTILGIKMHILVPAVGFYIQHFRVWSRNPAGMFVYWNLELSSP